MPYIRIPSPLRAFTNDQSQIPVAAGTVGNALAELTGRYPQLREHLFQGDELRNFVNLFIGEEDVHFLQGLGNATARGRHAAHPAQHCWRHCWRPCWRHCWRPWPDARGDRPLQPPPDAAGSRLEGQQRLKESSVLLVGAGGLGSPLALYLAAAGVGRIGIVDFDKVDESNLQRQVLHGQSDIGSPKLASARRRRPRSTRMCAWTRTKFPSLLKMPWRLARPMT